MRIFPNLCLYYSQRKSSMTIKNHKKKFDYPCYGTQTLSRWLGEFGFGFFTVTLICTLKSAAETWGLGADIDPKKRILIQMVYPVNL